MGDATLPLLLVQLFALVAGLAYIRRLPQSTSSPLVPSVSVLAICVVMAVFVFWISEPLVEPRVLFTDFRKAYYPAGSAVLQGPAALAPLLEQGVGGFVNLPIVAYLFAPFGLLPVRFAAQAYFVLGVAAILLSWFLLAREAGLKGAERWLLLFLFAANGPMLNSLKEGNTSHMVLLALVAGHFLLRTNRALAAGVILGLSALVKLPFLIFAPYLLLRRPWASAVGFGSVVAAGALLSVAVFGWAANQRWLELCVLPFSSNPVAAFNVQSIPGFLARLSLGPDVLREWSSLPAEPLHRLIGSALAAAMLLGAVLASTVRPSKHAEPEEWKSLEYCLVATLAVIMSPLSWSHYYVWLLVPIAFFLRQGSSIAPSGWPRRLAWIAIVIVSQAVVIIPIAAPVLAAFYSKLLVSSLLFGGLIWYGLLVAARASLGTEGAAAKDMKRA
jgi:hypothetical protein